MGPSGGAARRTVLLMRRAEPRGLRGRDSRLCSGGSRGTIPRSTSGWTASLVGLWTKHDVGDWIPRNVVPRGSPVFHRQIARNRRAVAHALPRAAVAEGPPAQL